MVVQPHEVLKSLHSTQIKLKVEVEKEAISMVIHEIRANNNNRKTGPMEEDVVTLEARGAKEDAVHGKGTST